MNDTQQMFRKIINGQSALKSELLSKIGVLDHKIDKLEKGQEEIKTEMKQMEKRLTKRIDKIGYQEAVLDEDAVSYGDFDELEKRVTNLEEKVSPVT